MAGMKKMKKINGGLHFQTFIQMNFISHRTPDNISMSRHSGSEMGNEEEKKGNMVKSKEEQYLGKEDRKWNSDERLGSEKPLL